MNERERGLAEGILCTDMYQLTMAQLYFRSGLHETEALFDHSFRSYPSYNGHQAGYCINAGLEWLVDWMRRSRFRDEDLECLRAQRGATGRPLFHDDFLGWLREHGDFTGISMRAVPEGRVVHPGVPVTVVEGPLAMAQILESCLLNRLNYAILVATKASRIRLAGRGGAVLEFGLRRAHDGGAHAGARAAMIGGADFTSNTGLSCALGFPPKGTHAHSMVQAFMALGGSELDAFRAYAELYPDDCLLLVDTVDTLGSGVPNAIRVFGELRSKGHEPVGVRLDSGDLAFLAIQAASMLDEAGFPDTKIVMSNQLDELVLLQIIDQIREESPHYGVDADRLIGRLVYGVGTKLITSEGDPALDGVYKLVGLREGAMWKPAIKVSESSDKVPNPGRKKVWRLYDRRGYSVADLIGLDDENPREADRIVLRHPLLHTKYRTLEAGTVFEIEPLLVDVLRDGEPIGSAPSIDEMRRARDADLQRLDPGVRRLMNPHIYHVSLTERLWHLKQDLITSARSTG